eukprot:24203-Amorphochlora_amoeboformis.AAC.2
MVNQAAGEGDQEVQVISGMGVNEAGKKRYPKPNGSRTPAMSQGELKARIKDQNPHEMSQCPSSKVLSYREAPAAQGPTSSNIVNKSIEPATKPAVETENDIPKATDSTASISKGLGSTGETSSKGSQADQKDQVLTSNDLIHQHSSIQWESINEGKEPIGYIIADMKEIAREIERDKEMAAAGTWVPEEINEPLGHIVATTMNMKIPGGLSVGLRSIEEDGEGRVGESKGDELDTKAESSTPNKAAVTAKTASAVTATAIATTTTAATPITAETNEKMDASKTQDVKIEPKTDNLKPDTPKLAVSREMNQKGVQEDKGLRQRGKGEDKVEAKQQLPVELNDEKEVRERKSSFRSEADPKVLT